VRRGANGKPIYRISLPGTDEFNLSWVYDVEAERPKPEIRLFRMLENGAVWDIEEEWDWRESLLGEASSLPFDRHFTLEDGTWDRVVGYPIVGDVYVHEDYASPVGVTIRFGDGEFGMIPPEGSVFRVEYRLNTGENVQRDILTQLITPLGFVAGITNAISAVNALPPEGVQSIRTNAPEAFRSVTYRAVRPEDYAEAAERLDWVQRAGSSVRWTGSWRTIFTSADPRRAVTISRDQRRDLDEQLDRFRQAGQDAQQRPPRYADLDIEIDICAEAFAYPGEVEAAVIEALVGEGGFFSPDNFTFGTPLYRGALEAAAQRAYGVRGVEEIRFRRHGWFDWKPFAVSEKSYDPGIDTIIRVQNDPAYPERGTLRVIVEGGA
jgi:predicted phage baseplate assembly protein